jgi:hypothetical protein
LNLDEIEFKKIRKKSNFIGIDLKFNWRKIGCLKFLSFPWFPWFVTMVLEQKKDPKKTQFFWKDAKFPFHLEHIANQIPMTMIIQTTLGEPCIRSNGHQVTTIPNIVQLIILHKYGKAKLDKKIFTKNYGLEFYIASFCNCATISSPILWCLPKYIVM